MQPQPKADFVFDAQELKSPPMNFWLVFRGAEVHWGLIGAAEGVAAQDTQQQHRASPEQSFSGYLVPLEMHRGEVPLRL